MRWHGDKRIVGYTMGKINITSEQPDDGEKVITRSFNFTAEINGDGGAALAFGPNDFDGCRTARPHNEQPASPCLPLVGSAWLVRGSTAAQFYNHQGKISWQKQKQEKAFSLDSLDLATPSNEGSEIELLHPTTSEPLGIFIRVLGKYSQVFIDHQRKSTNEYLRRAQQLKKRGKDDELPTAEKFEARGIELLVACTVAWRTGDKQTLNLKGLDRACTKETQLCCMNPRNGHGSGRRWMMQLGILEILRRADSCTVRICRIRV